MSIMTASHTPAHIAALFDLVCAQMLPQAQQHNAPMILCSSLPETLQEDARYILLCNEQYPHPQVTTVTPPITLYMLTQEIQALTSDTNHIKPLGKYWQLDIHKRELSPKAANTNNQMIALTELETKLIAFLAQHIDQAVARDKLIKAVWGYDETIETHTLETHLYRLRHKIESATPQPFEIHMQDGAVQLNIADISTS